MYIANFPMVHHFYYFFANIRKKDCTCRLNQLFLLHLRNFKNRIMKTILVAEDTDSNYLLLNIILRKKYNLVRAINGKQAVEMYQESKPDLILMDMKMPVMDGLEATREIRKMDSEVVIIALTANAFDSDRQKSLDAGCNDYMAKPVIAADVQQLIERYI